MPNSQAQQVPGIKIFSFGSSLFFANAEYFVDELYEKTGFNPELMLAQSQDKADDNQLTFSDVILDFSSVVFIDSAGVETVQRVLTVYFSI